MRLIGTLQNQADAKRFSIYLQNLKIENTCDISLDKVSDEVRCAIWVHDEDATEKAATLLQEFTMQPNDPKFAVVLPPTKRAFSAIENPVKPALSQPKKSGWPSCFYSYLLLFLCSIIFLGNKIEENTITEQQNGRAPLSTSLKNSFLYDLPEFLVQGDQLLNRYQLSADTPQDKWPVAAKKELRKLDYQYPFFQGLYRLLITKIQDNPVTYSSMFTKIREGQLWRIVSPAFFHQGFFYLFFNMLWLSVLAPQIEKRVLAGRFLLFVLISAAITNAAQYLVSGPLFWGFSGVITAMAGFIWMRQRSAPWEGYPIADSTFLFLGFCVIAVFLMQFFSFLSILVFNLPEIGFMTGNTGHIVGGLLGIGLARLNFFSWRSD